MKKRVDGLKVQILKHEDKIKNEKSKQFSDEGKIHHWEAEIKEVRKMKTLVYDKSRI
ncbi:MAG: hypothetical protein HZA07_07975, partial [Nitrospirae bacterium]|nr:hypothetical protein [Nitrospirota bacterium]